MCGASIHMQAWGWVRGWFAGAVILMLVGLGRAAATESLPKPSTAPILVIAGKIAATNADGTAEFDLALLKSLPEVTIKTVTPWTEGEHDFAGVRLRDLLARIGAGSDAVTASAADDYQVSIPAEDFGTRDVIVAYALDGKPLPVEDKGPLWIVYPFSSEPSLQKDIYFARCVWQLKRLQVE